MNLVPHAVARLRAERLARSSKPFLARGGPGHGPRCEGCRLRPSHCLCGWRRSVNAPVGVCLLMADIEALKPSNTGWLIADLLPDTWAFGWSRTAVDPGLLRLLADPQWQPWVVFPGEFVDAARVHPALDAPPAPSVDPRDARRPLLVLLDGTWAEARKMFRKSPYLDALPVLSLRSDAASRYVLRRSCRSDHFCTAEVAALCLEQAGAPHAGAQLLAWLDLFTHHYLRARAQLPPDLEGPEHQRWRALHASMDQARTA